MANINMLCFVLALYVTGALLSGDHVLAKCEVDTPSLVTNIIEPCRSSLVKTHGFHSRHRFRRGHRLRNHHRHHRLAEPPSPECCSGIGRSDVSCICEHYPEVMERFVTMSKFAALLGSCGHEYSKEVTCGGIASGGDSRGDNGSEINE